MVALETGRASDGFWGPPDGPEAKAAALEVRSPISASGTLAQSKSSGARRALYMTAYTVHTIPSPRGLPDNSSTDPRLPPPPPPPLCARRTRRVVALHVAALGEDFLPYSSGGKPVRFLLSAGGRDNLNEEKAARA
ncbi:unnamed protein product [Ectocarpus sp. 12 AP-2014]